MRNCWLQPWHWKTYNVPKKMQSSPSLDRTQDMAKVDTMKRVCTNETSNQAKLRMTGKSSIHPT